MYSFVIKDELDPLEKRFAKVLHIFFVRSDPDPTHLFQILSDLAKKNLDP
jgi:hypothetical protein